MDQLIVRRIGNSLGVTFPKPLQIKLGLKAGQALDARTDDHELVLTLPERPRYALSDLIAQCDPKAPMPADLREWDEAPAVGREVM